ncbi:MAG: Hpt domain-containing protein, partial [Rhizobacter sp.]|nr:Hpt domain-containing protein [Rhizobacter sp.]
MDESASAGGNAAAGIDLTQFYQVFFEEAGENLDRMERQLLDIEIDSADDEALNAIFRCAHSVKGGAATFGFSDVAELTHQMETLLDKLRRHELAPTAAMVDVLLQSGDALRAQLARHQGAGGGAADTGPLLDRMRAMIAGKPAASAAVPMPVLAPAAVAAPSDGVRLIELRVGPLQRPEQADNLVELFQEITDLGHIEPLDGGQASEGMRRFKVLTSSSDSDLLDLFTFHVARESVALLPFSEGYGFYAGAPGAPPQPDVAQADPGYGFFDAAPVAPPATSEGETVSLSGSAAGGGTRGAAARGSKAPAAAQESATLRVSVEKVDQLINLVGELVITQAMLSQNSARIDPALYQQLAACLANLDRNTRDLQESVMSIRMIPMSVVFNRFPRMLRDLAGKLGKKVDFVTKGEATELDKGMVEKLTDPLTHLVRNSCDHGIEMPHERIARGKPAQGTITLSALHQGGSIVIEVRDDGKGLSRERLLRKARE